MCVVTALEDPTKKIEDNNMPEYLNEQEVKSIPKKKRLESALTRYMDRGEKVKENMNKI